MEIDHDGQSLVRLVHDGGSDRGVHARELAVERPDLVRYEGGGGRVGPSEPLGVGLAGCRVATDALAAGHDPTDSISFRRRLGTER